MKKIAIAYSSKYGQTKKIVSYMCQKIEQAGISCQILDATNKANNLESDIDAVIYGGPVYRGKFDRKLLGWVRHHRDVFSRVPTALFIVSLNAADKHEVARKMDIELQRKFMALSGWIPTFVTSIAGALKYREYSWPIRFIMRKISRKAGGDTNTSKNYEYTNWIHVDDFLDSFLHGKADPLFYADSQFSDKNSKVAQVSEFLPAWKKWRQLRKQNIYTADIKELEYELWDIGCRDLPPTEKKNNEVIPFPSSAG